MGPSWSSFLFHDGIASWEQLQSRIGVTCLGQLQAGAKKIIPSWNSNMGTIPLGGEPTGRIIQDDGYFKSCSSINASHADTSIRYDSLMKLVPALDGVSLYNKADL